MSDDPLAEHQADYDIRLEWGPRGAFEAARRGDVVVLVDVLSFCTAVTSALEHGAAVIPFRHGDPEAAAAEAERLGAEHAHAADGRKPKRALSPRRYTARSRGTTLLLPSPNGATCATIAADAAAVLLGCLRNATAAAAQAQELAREAGARITVVPCGERWLEREPAAPQGLRPCVEDQVGAGAIVTALDGRRSPEAELAANAFVASLRDLTATLLECVSGRELAASGYEKDVRFASAWDASTIVPRLHGDRFPAPGGKRSG